VAPALEPMLDSKLGAELVPSMPVARAPVGDLPVRERDAAGSPYS